MRGGISVPWGGGMGVPRGLEFLGDGCSRGMIVLGDGCLGRGMGVPDTKESNDVRFVALCCIVLELSACENSVEFLAQSGCKANDLTRYKVHVDT